MPLMSRLATVHPNQGEKSLVTLVKLACETCLPDIESCWNSSAAVVELNNQMLNLAVGTPLGSKLLSPGRVVILRDQVRSCQYRYHTLISTWIAIQSF